MRCGETSGMYSACTNGLWHGQPEAVIIICESNSDRVRQVDGNDVCKAQQ